MVYLTLFIFLLYPNVRVIITGDDQRGADTINECLKKSFLNPKRVRCGWHILDRGRERNLRCMIGCTEKLQITMVLNQ